MACIIGITAVGCGKSNGNSNQTASTCKSTTDYQNGYNIGKEEAKNKADRRDYTDNSYSYLHTCNNGEGIIGSVSSCWHDGFADGFKQNDK